MTLLLYHIYDYILLLHTEHFKCPANTVKCPNSFCIPLKFVCDGKMQCPDGQDEADCGKISKNKHTKIEFV